MPTSPENDFVRVTHSLGCVLTPWLLAHPFTCCLCAVISSMRRSGDTAQTEYCPQLLHMKKNDLCCHQCPHQIHVLRPEIKPNKRQVLFCYRWGRHGAVKKWTGMEQGAFRESQSWAAHQTSSSCFLLWGLLVLPQWSLCPVTMHPINSYISLPSQHASLTQVTSHGDKTG